MLVNKNLVLSALDCNAIFLTIGVKENKHKACAVWGDRSLGSLCHTKTNICSYAAMNR